MRSFFAELRRRNVLRAGALYVAGTWALAQGFAQLFPVVGLPDWIVRWFLVAAAIGFPFFLAFAWFYEFTPQGLKRESEIDPAHSITQHTGKTLDRWIIAVLALAVVLLLTNTLIGRKALRGGAETASVAENSIAVLPLANESGDTKDDYFSDGLSEDLITALSQFAGLKVISRNSSFQFRDTKENSRSIGEKLGVAHLLEGSVRRAGDYVRVSAALVKAADGSTAWSERYDRPYKDLFKLQDEITEAVATSLKARLLTKAGAVVQTDRPPSGNLDAYSAYLKGTYAAERVTEADCRAAIDEYAEAIRIDPRYAQAYASQSRTWTLLGGAFLGGSEAQQAYANAREISDKALALDPNLAAAHVARGRLSMWADFDWDLALAEFRRARELAPNDGRAKAALAEIEMTLGHSEEAVALIRDALATDSRNATHQYWLGNYLIYLQRFDEAEKAIRRSIELQPTTAYAYPTLAVIEILRGNADAALDAAQKTPPGVWRDIGLSLATQIGTDRAAADAALNVLIETHADVSAYQIADTYALRKDPDRMFEWLDRAWTNRDPGLNQMLWDSFFVPYRSDPRFAAFCRKIGLPAPQSTIAEASR